MNQSPSQITLVLPDIRSSHNVGSIFRTADAAGVSRIILTGYTPCPVDKFKRPSKEIAKTALGAEQVIPWEYSPEIGGVMEKLKSEGYYIVALEQSPKAIDYRKVDLKDKNKVAIIVGNEVGGVDQLLLDQCDVIAEIPMKGKKESLNVAVATGVLLFSF